MNHGITAEDLYDRMHKSEPPVLLDCRFDLLNPTYAREAYDKAHIPGAYFLDVDQDLTREKSQTGGNHPFQTPERLKTILEAFGISNDTDVVVYDDGDLNGPTRFLYQALQLGLTKVAVLNGGLPAYLKAGGTTTGESTPLPTDPGNICVNYKADMVVDMATVRDSLNDPNTILIDSRARARYLGKEEPVYPVAGHIPGAVNYYCGDVVADGFLLSPDRLAKHFSALDPTKRIILSCGSGISACINSFALMQLNIPHTLYNGSYSEWIQFPENPVHTGAEDDAFHQKND